MVLVYNTRSVQSMDEKIRDSIINAGVPIEFYTRGILNIGANNRSALKRLANTGSLITKYGLPLPPSLFTEFVVDMTTGKSKRDYRITLDDEPGGGKSYTSKIGRAHV